MSKLKKKEQIKKNIASQPEPKRRDMQEYFAAFPKETKEILEKICATIKKIIPNAEETISYAIPTFKLNGVNLVHFAAFKNHIGFYATPSGHEEFKEELAKYKQGKGSVQFPLDKPIPYDLIKRIVKFRIKEIESKTKIISHPAKDQENLIQYFNELKHPLKKEILSLRNIILETNKGLTENIKWNAPNFCFEGEDRITMRIHPPTQIQLIFHRGAKVQKLPSKNLIVDDKELLVWKTTDRAIATFKDQNDIKAKSKNLKIIINEWLKASKKTRQNQSKRQ